MQVQIPLATVFDCDSCLCAGRIFGRKSRILGEMWHLWCVSKCGGGEKKEVGNAELGGKSAFISAITFLLVEDYLDMCLF